MNPFDYGKTFQVTADHLACLRRANVDWCSSEFGAPCIDPKRPYGNSDVVGDMARILGVPTVDTDDGEHLPPGTTERMRCLHRELEVVLQIALSLGVFAEGCYELVDYRTWKRVS